MKIHSPRHRTLAAATGVLVAAATVVVAQAPLASGVAQGTESTYVVLYKGGASSADAATTVSKAGGRLIANYTQIGVAVARSSATNFASQVTKNRKVSTAARTEGLGVRLDDDQVQGGGAAGLAPATWGDTLSGLQWDMSQIHVPEAHAVNAGSSSVLVADLDTGLDFSHPDLAPAYDAANSTDCTSGAPSPLLAGNDKNGHGTHTAGTIAAAANGIGIVGVAPGVRIAGVKTGNDDGYFFPEAVICAYIWSGTHGVDVTNNSYFADPWLFNCANDPGQRAIWLAERRAIRFAQSRGVAVVASEGNESTDLSHPTVDLLSPDFPPGTETERAVTNACSVVPVEVPGVVGVTATGNLRMKSFYSSYGISTADVAAPGGDSILQVTADAPNGRVLSTYPATAPCLRPVVDPTGATYCYLQGTSMAGPHAVGVAALIASARGLRGGALAAALGNATNALPCPTDVSAYGPFPQNSGAPQTCSGGATHNSWFGSGEVDALKAVS
jgi:subtilisin family serine protease